MSYTYKKPKERTKMTESFVRGVIRIFHTKKIGRMPNDQSVSADIAQCAYVTLARIGDLRHVPCPSPYCVQRKLIGVHWKRRKKKYIVLKIRTIERVVKMTTLWYFLMESRRK